jgi:predicted enzyme related to lactoylglutathione lyase
MLPIPENACEAGARPGWLGYIAVKDADACASSVQAMGGRIHRAPEDIPGYGRFAVLADPQGAAFAVIAPAANLGSAPSIVYRPRTPGFGGWHELYADDAGAALDFYASVFGWTRDQAFDLGAMGIYQLFATGGVAAGGMMKRCADTPGPSWNYYFNTESVEASAVCVREAGGQILMGPHQVPDGSWILMALDPQGAVFCLVSQKP